MKMGIIIIIINIIIIWIRVDYLHAKCQKRLRVIRKSKEALRKHHLHIYGSLEIDGYISKFRIKMR